MSARGDGEGIFDEVRAVEELRMVVRDSVIVLNPLPLRDTVWGDSGRDVGRRVAKG